MVWETTSLSWAFYHFVWRSRIFGIVLLLPLPNLQFLSSYSELRYGYNAQNWRHKVFQKKVFFKVFFVLSSLSSTIIIPYSSVKNDFIFKIIAYSYSYFNPQVIGYLAPFGIFIQQSLVRRHSIYKSWSIGFLFFSKNFFITCLKLHLFASFCFFRL